MSSLTTSRCNVVRQSLHLRIDPSPYNSQVLISPHSYSPSSSSARTSTATARTTPTSDSPGCVIFSVLCLYDFVSNDSDHLPFSKNEILEVVKQEDSGWWAAMRSGGNLIGWIPQAFVVPLSDEMTERLRNVRSELRIYEYEAEKLYNSVSVVRNDELYAPDPEPFSSSRKWGDNGTRPNQRPDNKAKDQPQNGPRADDFSVSSRPYPPPSPSTPMPHPPARSAVPYYKPAPPATSEPADRARNRAGSVPIRNLRRQPVILDDNTTLTRLSTLIESGNSVEIDKLASPEVGGSFEGITQRTNATKCKKRAGSDAEWALRTVLQAHVPWYLRPVHSDELEVDNEGHVRIGTFDALVERLSLDTRDSPNKLTEDMPFINAFLMTFRTFTTADRLFDLLVERFRMDHPKNVSDAEFEEWRTKCLLPTQRKVLTIFTMWLEDHRLLEEEPQIAQRLTDFLLLIATPPLAVTAKLIVQTIERLTFATPGSNSSMAPRKARKSKAHKNDLLKIDSVDMAEQLSLYEFQLYAKVSPQECISYAKIHSGKPVANLLAFCATHDKLGAWVRMSILNHDSLGKRADTADFWIKVAERCRQLNNFASMSAIIIALSSTVIARLHLTWAHVNRKSTLDTLLRHNEPTGGFSGYRSLLSNVEGSCVPFIGMFLTDIAHIQEQYSDEDGRICFYQRQRWYDTVSTILRYQSKPYNIAPSESTRPFIEGHLKEASMRDQHWFWTRSQEVQQSELAHADIRKGLEAAGF